MQKVSKEYKASMKDSLRERAYIMISFGVVNQEAQAKARVDSGEFAYFSNPDNLFNEGTDDVVYATLEEKTVVQVGNRVVTDAVTTQKKANGYSFTG